MCDYRMCYLIFKTYPGNYHLKVFVYSFYGLISLASALGSFLFISKRDEHGGQRKVLPSFSACMRPHMRFGNVTCSETHREILLKLLLGMYFKCLSLGLYCVDVTKTILCMNP